MKFKRFKSHMQDPHGRREFLLGFKLVIFDQRYDYGLDFYIGVPGFVWNFEFWWDK